MKIHPQAVISPAACLGRDVVVGPFCIVEPGAVIGDGTVLEARVTVKSGCHLGAKNHVFEGAVIGGLPQHAQMPKEVGGLVVGEGNTIRENVTIHRALHPGTVTTIGDRNLLMVNVHVAHDCHLGNGAIIANNTMLAGHVTIEDRAYVSGAVAVHQFCRIGRLAMVGGQAHVTKDIPPYVTIDGASTYVVGLNLVGLRRSGFSPEAIRELKEAYRLIYRSGLPWTEVIARLQQEFQSGPAAAFHEFLSSGTRGFTPERRLPPRPTLKLRRDTSDEQQGLKRKAG